MPLNIIIKYLVFKESAGDYQMLGLAYDDINKHQQAINAYSNSLKMQSLNHVVSYNLGTSLLNQKKYNSALYHFKNAQQTTDLELKAKVYVNMGKSYIAIKNEFLAYDFFQKSIELETALSTPYIEIAKYWNRQQNKEKVNEFFQKAIYREKKQNDKANIYAEWATLIQKSFNDIENANYLFEKSIQLSPNNIEILKKRALFYEKNNEFKKAITIYQKIIKISPKSYNIYEAMGKLFVKEAKFEQAKSIFQHLLEINPHYKSRNEIRKIIQNL